MKIAIDTNILVRGLVRDHPEQAGAAGRVLREASVIAIALPSIWEFVWVLRSVYDFTAAEISAAIQALLAIGTVAVNRPAVDAGLAIMNAGGATLRTA